MAGLLADLSLKISANTAELNKGLDKAKSSVNKFGKQTKDNSKKVGSAFSSIGDRAKGLGTQMTSQMGIAGEALNGLVGSFSGVTKGLGGASSALKVFKVALASTGIGLLVVALGSLVAYFTKTQKGADMVSKAMAGVSAVGDVIIDTLSELGEMLVWAFQNPQEALKNMGEAIKNFVLARFEQLIGGIKGIGTAFKLLFEKDFSGAAKAAGTALKDIAMSTTPVGLAMSVISDNLDTIKEKYGEASTEARKAFKLEEDTIQLQKDRIAFKVREAEMEFKMAEARRKSRDEEKYNEAERLSFIKEARKIQDELSNKRIYFAKEELRIKQETDALANNMRSDDEDTVDLQVKIVKLNQQREDAQRTLLRDQNTLTAQLETQLKLEEKLNAEKANQSTLGGGGIQKMTAQLDGVKTKALQVSEALKTMVSNGIPEETMEMYNAKMEQMQMKIELLREQAWAVGNAVGDAFFNMGNRIVDSLGLADSGFQGFIKGMAKTAMDLISMMLSQAIATAIQIGNLSALGTGIGAVVAQPAFIATAVGGILSAFASIPKFFSGGIVEGSPTGDQNLIRANGGEMMLNKSQQSNMFDMINRGGAMGGTQNIRITGRLIGSGNELVAVIDETNARNNRNF
jgi:hypothetical protein